MHYGIPMRKAFINFVWQWVFLPGLIAFILAGLFTGLRGIHTSISRHEAIAKFAAQRLEREITHLNHHLASLAEEIKGKSPQEAAYILNKALGEGFFESFYLVGRDGTLFLSIPSSSLLPSKFSPEGFSLIQSPEGPTYLFLTFKDQEGYLIASISRYHLQTFMAQELSPIYDGQLFLANPQGQIFPLFPPGLREKAISSKSFRVAFPIRNSNLTVVATFSLFKVTAQFLALGFASLLFGVLLWAIGMRTGLKHIERMAIRPLEIMLEGIKSLREGAISADFPRYLPGAAAEINYLLSSFREMAEEITAAQSALARSEKEKRLILEGVSDLVTFQDTELRIHWANKAAGDSVGKRPEELVGKHCYEIWHGRFSPCPNCPVLEAIRTDSYQQGEVTSPDGRVWFIRARPLKDENGKIIGAVETTTEITQQRRAEEEQKALTEILQALNALEAREAFPTLAESLSRLLGCQRIVLLLFDKETMTYRIINLKSELPVPELCDGTTFDAQKSAVTEALLAGEINYTTNLEEYSSFPIEKAVAQAGYRSRIVLPLRFEEELIGVLALLSTRPEPFWEGKIAFLRQVSNALAIALARDRFLQTEREERHLVQTLAETVALILKAQSPEEFLDLILEKAEQIVPGDAFNLMFIIGDYAQVVAHRGYEKWGVEDKISWLNFHLTDYQTLRKVYESGEPLLIPDTTVVPWWVKVQGFEWLKSYMCAPVKVEGRIVGFLNVDGARPHQFTFQDLRRLQAFADYVSLALEKARMIAELKDYSEQLERLVSERTAQLQARQAWLDAIFKGSSDGYLLLNPQGDVLEMNPMAWAWLKQAASPEEAKSVQETLREMVRHPEASSEAIKELGGKTFLLKTISLEPYYTGSLAILHDITQLKLLDKAKSKLLTDISHELRSPMAAIKLYAELLHSSPPEKMRLYLGQILESIDHMAKLLSDIMEVVRLGTGRVELSLSPVELNEFVKNASDRYLQEANKCQHRLEILTSPDNPTVMADLSRLQQILDNLVDNAIRYTPAGGRITISVRTEEEEGRLWGVIEVADNGIGIPEEELPHIFERFFRGEKARSEQIPGTGLGLAIVKELVELHHGKVKVRSKVGEGSVFTVMLPLLEMPLGALNFLR